MKTVKTILIVIVAFAVFFGGLLFFIGYFSPKPGGIRIETIPKASVFINGSLVGETPYEGTYKAGKILLRLVPQVSEENLIPYETSINITSGAQTVVGRTFASIEDESSGYVISFEKLKTKGTAFAATSEPDNSQVLIDGVSRGFSPYIASTIAPAMHTIVVKSPGYLDFSITVKAVNGYKLLLYTKLGQGGNPEEALTESVQERRFVKILETPTGYLRVRTKPGEEGSEIAQVKTGEQYPYIDTDVETGWVEIQYQAPKEGMPSGIVGFVSGDYVSVVEAD